MQKSNLPQVQLNEEDGSDDEDADSGEESTAAEGEGSPMAFTGGDAQGMCLCEILVCPLFSSVQQSPNPNPTN